MSLRINSDFNGVTDPDAGAYIAAVEAADGQLLEFAVGKAINDFVVGCKADGIWSAIKASCILAGARTLSGALVPLAGTAPTNVGGLFVQADYNRKTGLIGNGSTKYLNSNRAGNADPQNSTHLAAYISSFSTGGYATYLGAHSSSGTISSFMRNDFNGGGSFDMTCNSNGGTLSRSKSLGFAAVSRNSSSSYTSRIGFQNVDAAVSSGAISSSIYVFADNYPSPTPRLYSNGRLAFYSIGEYLDLAKLDARVTALINAFGAAIP